MFKEQTGPRVFGLPPGADFVSEIVIGILQRCQKYAPHELARIEIFVNTTRLQRGLHKAFSEGSALLLPRIRLITDLVNSDFSETESSTISSLRRRLELAKFTSALLHAEPELAPRSSLYPLADSLADLFEEMESEQVPVEKLLDLDVADQSGHWQRSLKFLGLISEFADQRNSLEARLVSTVNSQIDSWKERPPRHPVLFVGSTASRATTRKFMKAISELPQGAVVLPGFDFHLLTDVWDNFARQNSGRLPSFEDHPQYRFQFFLNQLGLHHSDVDAWTNLEEPISNELISLSLQPAPVTDQWMKSGPKLGDIESTTTNFSLVEANSPRAEAEAIALRLRQSAQAGQTAALVSPDRNLTRQVTAALDRWNLSPDDSAGVPLQLTAPGRLLRHVLDLLTEDISPERLLILLKHPLIHSGRDDRGEHLLRTRELEMEIRNIVGLKLDQEFLEEWKKEKRPDDQQLIAWVNWIIDLTMVKKSLGPRSIAEWFSHHMQIAERLCAGPLKDGSGELWKEGAGRKAQEACNALERETDTALELTAQEYAALVSKILSGDVVRDRDQGHPNILILGALEARVHSAELVILGGMNESIWPAEPQSDPWLNRALRKRIGLLSPERQIGLSAHDYQQAIAAKEVMITRSLRTSDSETVPSRWVNRLLNLMQGLPENGGPNAILKMRNRGQFWTDQAEKLAAPNAHLPQATRPSPRPPISVRPKELSITRIKSLIRDPYSIYAEKILGLRNLESLTTKPQAQLRGIIFHKIIEIFTNNFDELSKSSAHAKLIEIAEIQLNENCPWPATRVLWRAQFERIAARFVEDEFARRESAATTRTEIECSGFIESQNFNIHGIADRIDLLTDRTAILYDYKTGSLPTKKQQELFDKQLLIEAAMLEFGHFEGLGPTSVQKAEYVGINEAMKRVPAPLDTVSTEQIWSQLETLIAKWFNIETGYSARLALFKKEDMSVYDHLSRFGEWSISDNVSPETLE